MIPLQLNVEGGSVCKVSQPVQRRLSQKLMEQIQTDDCTLMLKALMLKRWCFFKVFLTQYFSPGNMRSSYHPLVKTLQLV